MLFTSDIIRIIILALSCKSNVGALDVYGTDCIMKGGLRSIYLTTYKRQIIDLKLTISTGSFSFSMLPKTRRKSHVTQRLTRPSSSTLSTISFQQHWYRAYGVERWRRGRVLRSEKIWLGAVIGDGPSVLFKKESSGIRAWKPRQERKDDCQV